MEATFTYYEYSNPVGQPVDYYILVAVDSRFSSEQELAIATTIQAMIDSSQTSSYSLGNLDLYLQYDFATGTGLDVSGFNVDLSDQFAKYYALDPSGNSEYISLDNGSLVTGSFERLIVHETIHGFGPLDVVTEQGEDIGRLPDEEFRDAVIALLEQPGTDWLGKLSV